MSTTSDMTHSADSQDLAALSHRAAHDRLRPGYHFIAPGGWLNDPNGVAQHEGLYHLFYQHNPHGAAHDRIHWGHAVSSDLVRWEERPLALIPGRGADRDGCWSGVVVFDQDTPTIIYSGRVDGVERPCLAVGSADLERWDPLPEAVITDPPRDRALSGFRDHCVWREQDEWRQLVGSGTEHGGCTFLYRSDDLRSWTLLGTLASLPAGETALDDPTWTGTMWECVDFFRMAPGADGRTGPPDGDSDDPHVLLFSAWHQEHTLHPLAAVGTYDGGRFHIEHVQRLDFGGRHAYAPQSFIDESGRRVLWAWMQEGRDATAQRRAGWSGAMTAPRRIRLTSDRRVGVEPVAELASLRTEELPVRRTSPQHADLAVGAAVDIELELDLPPGESADLRLFATADEEEHTRVILSRGAPGTVELSADRSRSSLDARCDSGRHAGEVPVPGRRVTVRILVDASAVEIFVDGASLTTRVYPTRSDAVRHRLRLSSGAELLAARSWRMADLSSTRRPVVG